MPRSWYRRPRLLLPLALSAPLAGGVSPVARHRHEIRVPAEGALLPDIPAIESQHGVLRTVLTLEATLLKGPNVSLETRTFNGSVPGPALAVRPGDVLSLLFVNKLEAPLGPDADNNYHHPNHTNLHVHGLHVSPLAPSDDVTSVRLRPGESYHYEYRLPRDHSPGTYWVHPHHHGSAVLQSGAGAAGALLVLDPPGFLSPQLTSLRDRALVLQAFPRKALQKAATASHDNLFRVGRWGLGPELWLVNGAPRPRFPARPGEWQRLRLIAAGVSTWLRLSFGACEVALLAKDGIYIGDFPRYVRFVSLPQGGRADLALRCPGGAEGRPAEHEVVSSPLPGGSKAFVGTVFTIRVEGPAAVGLASEPLQPWRPPSRPAYLQDLRPRAAACSCATSLGLGGNSRWVEGHLWQGPAAYQHVSPLDAVVERRLSGLAKHPYHAHTFPFQLQASPRGDDPYFRGGDWHDTYLNVLDSSATVRFHTVDFPGPQVVHCHNPAHSDMGMIAVELVARGRDPGLCGCDVLGASEEAMDSAPWVRPLAAGALVLLLAMFGLVGGMLLQLARCYRAAADEREKGYAALDEAPSAAA